jgi:hypothetical protein
MILNDGLERTQKDVVMSYILRYCDSICIKEMRKMKAVSKGAYNFNSSFPFICLAFYAYFFQLLGQVMVWTEVSSHANTFALACILFSCISSTCIEMGNANILVFQILM